MRAMETTALFSKKLEERKLRYLGSVAKNRKIIIKKESEIEKETRIDELAKSLPAEQFKSVTLELEKEKTIWVALVRARISSLQKERTFAIVMNASSVEKATDIDYFITNFNPGKVTAEWLVATYSQRNWVEVFYREAKGWLGLREYQVRDKRSLLRHFILVLSGKVRKSPSSPPLRLCWAYPVVSFEVLSW